VVVDGSDVDFIEQPHHLLGDPDVFIGVHRFNATMAAGSNNRQVLRSREAGDGIVIFLGSLRLLIVVHLGLHLLA
jgi:hypothetical protein